MADEHMAPNRQRLFQISESDLAELERLVPVIAEAAAKERKARSLCVAIRRTKNILCGIRWHDAESEIVDTLPAE